MRVLVLLLLCVSALAVNPPAEEKHLAAVGGEAGAEAGAAEGAVAGKVAGAEEGTKVFNELQKTTPEPAKPEPSNTDPVTGQPVDAGVHPTDPIDPVTSEHPEHEGAPPKPTVPGEDKCEICDLWKKLEKEDPGAVAFFREFDADGNKYWNQQEFITAMEYATHHFLPPDFDVTGEWERMPKNAHAEIGLKDFLEFASKQPAHHPEPKPAEHEEHAEPEHTEPVPHEHHSQCTDSFLKYAKTHQERPQPGLEPVMTREEFFESMAGSGMDENTLKDVWQHLPKTEKGNLRQADYVGFCAAYTSLKKNPPPGTDTHPQPPADPCASKPCPEDKVCVPEPKSCASTPCHQYTCVPKATPSEPATPGEPEPHPHPHDPYGTGHAQCVDIFHFCDVNKDKQLTQQEWHACVTKAQTDGHLSKQLDLEKEWKAPWLKKNKDGNLEVESFVYQCLRWAYEVYEHFGGAHADARTKAAEAFHFLDKNADGYLTKDEFIRGIEGTIKEASGEGHALFNLESIWNNLPHVDNKLGFEAFMDWALLGSDLAAAGHHTLDQIPVDMNSEAIARQECGDVFFHWDQNGSGDLNIREFFIGFRAAVAQGHAPYDLSDGPTLRKLYELLPKEPSGDIGLNTFVDLCLTLSHYEGPNLHPVLSEEIHKKIEELLGGATGQLPGTETEPEPPTPKPMTQITLEIEGDVETFDKAAFKKKMSVLLKVPEEDIRIKQILKGSVKVILEVPEVVEKELLEHATSGDFNTAGIQLLWVEDATGHQTHVPLEYQGVSEYGASTSYQSLESTYQADAAYAGATTSYQADYMADASYMKEPDNVANANAAGGYAGAVAGAAAGAEAGHAA